MVLYDKGQNKVDNKVSQKKYQILNQSKTNRGARCTRGYLRIVIKVVENTDTNNDSDRIECIDWES